MAKTKNKLPKSPFANIALSLSGGGYRATAFHLGSLSYLSTVQFSEKNLLEQTRILSTVSAGTFVGVKYITSLKKGETIKTCYDSVYKFITECDLVSEALKFLSDDKNWEDGRNRTLINAFSAVYHDKFESELFGLLWEENKEVHLKEICFNATEFNFGLPFRFQKTERSNFKSLTNEHEFIGNKKIHITEEIAKEIRLSDIIAASACFPFGFEPINFPDDFIHENAVNLKDKSLYSNVDSTGDKINYPIGLMDGSIDDNQGVDAVVLAEIRMRHYPERLQKYVSKDDKAVDLYIISDASCPKIDSYSRITTKKTNYFAKLNFESLRHFGILSAVLGAGAIYLAFVSQFKLTAIALTLFGTIGLVTSFVLLLFSIGLTGLARKLGVPEFAVRRLLHFNKLKLGTLYDLLINRRRSAMTLVSDVFIKHMRWFSYERVYGDPAWIPRLIMNAIFDFNTEEVDKRKVKYPYFDSDILEPGDKIIEVASKANSMGTRLWFKPEELDKNNYLPDAIIACGQYTMCYNLIEYIAKHLKNNKNQTAYDNYSDEIKAAIDQLETDLLKDWKRFKEDPYWMVKEWNAQ